MNKIQKDQGRSVEEEAASLEPMQAVLGPWRLGTLLLLLLLDLLKRYHLCLCWNQGDFSFLAASAL